MPKRRSIAPRSRTRLLLVALALACAPAPTEPPAATPGSGPVAVSESGRLMGRFEPESGDVVVGRFQPWVLELRRAGGEAVADASVSISGGMPGHGHGLPTQPRVTAYLGDGRYRVEGVKLNMYGDWVFVFDVRTSTSRDHLRVDRKVDY